MGVYNCGWEWTSSAMFREGAVGLSVTGPATTKHPPKDRSLRPVL